MVFLEAAAVTALDIGTVLVAVTVAAVAPALAAVTEAAVASEYRLPGHTQAAGLQLQELLPHSTLASRWIFPLRFRNSTSFLQTL